MRTPLASRPACKNSPDSILYGGRISIAKFIVAIALVLITLGVVFAQGDRAFLSEAETVVLQESASNKQS
jgi:hypothetical protein